MTIEVISSLDSPYLAVVKKLGKSNAGTLGFLPEGAFDDYARKGQIYIALDEQKNCLGYLLFRVAKRKASIVHLCIDKTYRKSGIAKYLVDKLKNDTANLLGIDLRCRLEYEASKVWGKLGFVSIGELEGRGKTREPLIYWWYSHGHRTLFDIDLSEELNERLITVADANVFYDLQDDTRNGYFESNALRADWLKDSIEICLVEEIYNEITRNEEKCIRIKSRDFASQFRLLKLDRDRFDATFDIVSKIFPKPLDKRNSRDESDIIQLTQAICSDAQYFVTRDEILLGMSSDIFTQLGLKILRPADLITGLDELRREADYQPSRLSGTFMQQVPIKSGQSESLFSIFHSLSQSEIKHELKSQVHRSLANPQECSCFQVLGEDNKPLALVIYNKSDKNSLKINLFRVRKNPLAPTLIKHLVLKAIQDSCKLGKISTRIEDKFITNEIEISSLEEGFFFNQSHLVKFNPSGVFSKQELSNLLKKLPTEAPSEQQFLFDLVSILEKPDFDLTPNSLLDLEKTLYPVKILDSYLPCFIIPIRPAWALELFDENLAKQNLFGAKTDLALRKEQIYYRSSLNANGLRAPARLLWYVSKGKAINGYQGTGAITASSYLEEVFIDKPKVLYQMFKRLGIYSWKEIYDLAKNDINNSIMALKFSGTELFNQPVEYPDLKNILEANESKIQVMSPFSIPPNAFIDIYKKGVIINKNAG